MYSNATHCICGSVPVFVFSSAFDHILQFCLLFPSSLSPFSSPLCTFMKHIHKSPGIHVNFLLKLKHLHRRVVTLISAAPGEFTWLLLCIDFVAYVIALATTHLPASLHALQPTTTCFSLPALAILPHSSQPSSPLPQPALSPLHPPPFPTSLAIKSYFIHLHSSLCQHLGPPCKPQQEQLQGQLESKNC